MNDKMKKLMFVAPALLGLSAFAADGDAASGTTTAVNAMLTNTQTALEGLITTGLPIVSAIVIGGLTIWGGFKLIRLIMKAFGFGTSR